MRQMLETRLRKVIGSRLSMMGKRVHCTPPIPLHYQLGQSLLEVTLALGILIIILCAITIVTINVLRNSQFSNNHAQPTKLPQDGLNKAKTILSPHYSLH